MSGIGELEIRVDMELIKAFNELQHEMALYEDFAREVRKYNLSGGRWGMGDQCVNHGIHVVCALRNLAEVGLVPQPTCRTTEPKD